MSFIKNAILVRHEVVDNPDSPLIGELLDDQGNVIYTHYKKYKIAFKYDPKDKHSLYINNKRLLASILQNEIYQEIINGTINYTRSVVFWLF